MVNKLDQANVYWFKPVLAAIILSTFESWVYLEARAAIKHRQTEIARKYVRILDSGSIQGKTHTDAPVITITSSYTAVVNMIQGAREEAKSSGDVNERSKSRSTADCSQMPDGTSKAVIGWQEKSALSVPTTQHRAGSAEGVSTRQQEPGSGVRWKCPACSGQHLYANARGEIYLNSRVLACKVFSSGDPEDRGKLLESIGGCRRCTSWMHRARNCSYNRAPSSSEKSVGDVCMAVRPSLQRKEAHELPHVCERRT